MSYYKLPEARVRLSDAAFGGLVGAALFAVTQRAFAYYVSLTTFYNAVYGVLAAVPLLLVWVFLAWAVVLFGAEISYNSGAAQVLRGTRRFRSDLGEAGGWLGVRIILSIAERFVRGHAPPSETEIAIESGADPVLVRHCLDLLAEAQLIAGASPEDLSRTLLVSPATLQVGRILETFRSRDALDHDENPDTELLDLIGTRAASRAGIPVSDWTVTDLLSEVLQEGVPSKPDPGPTALPPSESS